MLRAGASTVLRVRNSSSLIPRSSCLGYQRDHLPPARGELDNRIAGCEGFQKLDDERRLDPFVAVLAGFALFLVVVRSPRRVPVAAGGRSADTPRGVRSPGDEPWSAFGPTGK
jgi:hypothetical protein